MSLPYKYSYLSDCVPRNCNYILAIYTGRNNLGESAVANKIKFTFIGEEAYEVREHPVPSSQMLPQWFSDMSPYQPTETNPEGKRLQIIDGSSSATAKKCSPMLDAMTGGYTVCLWADVLAEKHSSGETDLSWRVKSPVFSRHGESGRLIPPPPGYGSQVLKYLTEFRVTTPPGYSILVKPVAGHYDLPFMPLTAVIDSDKSVIDTNIPVWVKKGLEGVVPNGTPIAQIIPFKREEWEMEVDYMPYEQYHRDMERGFSKTLVNNYIKNIRSKKSFK
jgi:hypothetical protein